MELMGSNWKAYNVEWAAVNRNDILFVQIKDDRKLSEIAAEFEQLEWLERADDNQGDKSYVGYNKVVSIAYSGESVLLQIAKGA